MNSTYSRRLLRTRQKAAMRQPLRERQNRRLGGVQADGDQDEDTPEEDAVGENLSELDHGSHFLSVWAPHRYAEPTPDTSDQDLPGDCRDTFASDAG